MPFAGFDSLAYPGDAMMQWMKKNTNLTFVGFYLAPAPSRPDSGWMKKHAVLASQGWGFAPVYVGQQEPGVPRSSHILTAAQGTIDGADACNLMVKAGFAPNSIVYLDCEQGGAASAATLQYVGAWVDAVRSNAKPYVPGIYCSYTTAKSLLAIRPDVRVWVWRITNPAAGPIFPAPDPVKTGVPQATVWQYFQKTDVTFPGAPDPKLNIDLDSASIMDPSQVPAVATAARMSLAKPRKKIQPQRKKSKKSKAGVVKADKPKKSDKSKKSSKPKKRKTR